MQQYPQLPPMDHDRFFRSVFGEPEQAASLLRFALPLEAASALDLDHIAPLPEAFVTSIGGTGQADLFFHCPIIGEPGQELLIAILFEHKSHPDPEALSQMAHYWANLVLKNQAMPVLPVLFYHGKESWKPEGFRNRFTHLPTILRQYQPDFPAVFVDLAREEDLQIREHPGLDPVTRIGLVFLKHIFDKRHDIKALVDRIAEDLVQVEEHRRASLLQSVFVYLMRKGAYESAPMEEIMDILPESQKMPFKTWEEGLREAAEAEGMAKGLAEGLEKGFTKGDARAKSEAIERMLAEGLDWALIERVTGVSEAEYPNLRKRV